MCYLTHHGPLQAFFEDTHPPLSSDFGTRFRSFYKVHWKREPAALAQAACALTMSGHPVPMTAVLLKSVLLNTALLSAQGRLPCSVPGVQPVGTGLWGTWVPLHGSRTPPRLHARGKQGLCTLSR